MRLLLAATVSSLLVVGCQQKNQPRESTRAGNPAVGDNTATGTSVSPSSGDESQLPFYLFKSQEAAAITQLVDAYTTPNFSQQPINGANLLSGAKNYIATFTKKVMALESLKPGRTFKVHIIDNSYPNAFADGFQNIGVHSGMLTLTSPLSSLAVLCHEMAHSTKNYSVKYDKLLVSRNLNAKYENLTTQIDSYMGARYNRYSGVYTHKKADYTQLKKAWDAFEKEFNVVSKRLESEADIVGSMICAASGLSVKDFIEGHRRTSEVVEKLMAQAGPSSRPEDLADNERVPLREDEVSDYLTQFLFPTDSHPSDAERIAQLERLSSIIDQRYDAKQTFSTEWQSQMKSLTGSSLQLTDSDLAAVVTQNSLKKTTSDGKTIVILRHKMCQHPR